MRRELLDPRPGWPAAMEAVGFHYHSVDGSYWDESRCYVFDEHEIDALEAATAELHQMALNAAQHVVGAGRWEEFAVPSEWVPAIEANWRARLDGSSDGFTLFGRMDLSYDGHGPAKLLEYNADTPTACLEASVAQWSWLQAVRPHADQFNSLHEKLIDRWRLLRSSSTAQRLHFAAVKDSAEDWGNTDYLRDTAMQAGWQTVALPIERIGWNGTSFVDEFNVPIELLFKLYPDHPNLLPAYYDPAPLGGRYAKKPKLAREGANVTLVDGGTIESVDGGYGAEGYVYQALAPLPTFGSDHTVVGSWIVGDAPAGIGIREDASPVTRNTSRFVPHYFT